MNLMENRRRHPKNICRHASPFSWLAVCGSTGYSYMVNQTVPRSCSHCPRAKLSLAWQCPGQQEDSQTLPALGLARDGLSPVGNWIQSPCFGGENNWMVWTQTILVTGGHHSASAMENGPQQIHWNRCGHCEIISVDLGAKLCLDCKQHCYAITSSLTLSLMDRHNKQRCFQVFLLNNNSHILLKTNQLIRFTFKNL